MHTRRTLQLNHATWDITLDGVGRIALVAGDGATAQAVANECRLFRNDAYFAWDKGIPHFVVELGKKRNAASALRAYMRKAAVSVEDVAGILNIDAVDFDPATRTLHGEIVFTTVQGEKNAGIRTYF